ncbi:hypothetical protein Tco_0837947 [Tanacetum coccineum]
MSASLEASWCSGILASGPGCLALYCPRSANNSACMSPISRLMSLITRRISTIFPLQYPAAVAISDVPRSGSHVHTQDHGGSEAHDELSDSILSSEPKPLGKHMPPPP